MSFQHSWINARAPVRVDHVDFVTLKIEESETGTSGWSLIDTQVWVPDADPANPQFRPVTTNDAQFEVGYYRFYWIGADNIPSERTDAVHSVTSAPDGLPPSPAEARARSPYLAEKYPAGPEGDTALALMMNDDCPVVSFLTGRSIGPGQPGEPVPDHLLSAAKRVLILRAERYAAGRQTSASIESAISDGKLRSISAGPWSESYFGPSELDLKTLKRLDVDPTIAELLWALCTPEKQEYWTALWTGVHAPAAAVVELPWGHTAMTGY